MGLYEDTIIFGQASLYVTHATKAESLSYSLFELPKGHPRGWPEAVLKQIRNTETAVRGMTRTNAKPLECDVDVDTYDAFI